MSHAVFSVVDPSTFIYMAQMRTLNFLYFCYICLTYRFINAGRFNYSNRFVLFSGPERQVCYHYRLFQIEMFLYCVSGQFLMSTLELEITC